MPADGTGESADSEATTDVTALAETVEPLRDWIDDRETTIQQLTDTFNVERRRRHHHESRHAELDRRFESRPAVEIRDDEDHGREIGDIWIGDLLVDKLAENTKGRTRDLNNHLETLAGRLERVERGEVDPSELVPSRVGRTVRSCFPSTVTTSRRRPSSHTTTTSHPTRRSLPVPSRSSPIRPSHAATGSSSSPRRMFMT